MFSYTRYSTPVLYVGKAKAGFRTSFGNDNRVNTTVFTMQHLFFVLFLALLHHGNNMHIFSPSSTPHLIRADST